MKSKEANPLLISSVVTRWLVDRFGRSLSKKRRCPARRRLRAWALASVIARAGHCAWLGPRSGVPVDVLGVVGIRCDIGSQ